MIERLPFHYKPNKTPHVVYYDVENVHLNGVSLIQELNIMHLNVSCLERYQQQVEQLKNINGKGSKKVLSFHCHLFNEVEKDKADQFLLHYLKSDGLRYKTVDPVHVLVSNDVKLQKVFINQAISSSINYMILPVPK